MLSSQQQLYAWYTDFVFSPSARTGRGSRHACRVPCHRRQSTAFRACPVGTRWLARRGVLPAKLVVVKSRAIRY